MYHLGRGREGNRLNEKYQRPSHICNAFYYKCGNEAKWWVHKLYSLSISLGKKQIKLLCLSLNLPPPLSPLMKILWLREILVRGREDIVWDYPFHRKTNSGSLQKVNERNSVTALETEQERFQKTGKHQIQTMI